MTTTQEKLEAVLVDLETAGGVDGSAIISRDGLVVVSRIPAEANSESFAALTATMAGAAETSVMLMDKGAPDSILVETEQVKLVTVGAGSELFLAVLGASDANLGMLRLAIKKAAGEVLQLVGA